MATLQERAELQLLINATEGIQDLAKFRARWQSELAAMDREAEGVELPPTSEETDAYGNRALAIVGDSDQIFQSFAAQNTELEENVQLWGGMSSVLRLIDPRLGSIAGKLTSTGAAIGTTSIGAASAVTLFARLFSVLGVGTAVVFGVDKAFRVAGDAINGTNHLLDYTGQLIKEVGFEKAGEDIKGYAERAREGGEILQFLADQQAKVKAGAEALRIAIEGDRAATEQARLEREEYRKELEKSGVSEERKKELLLKLAEHTREVTTETDIYGNKLAVVTAAEFELITALEAHEKKLRDVAKATQESIDEQEEHWRRFYGQLDDVLQIDALDDLDAKLKNLTNTFGFLAKEGSLSREEKVRLNEAAQNLTDSYERLGQKAPDALGAILKATRDLVGDADKLDKAIRGNREELERNSEALVVLGERYTELRVKGKLSAEAQTEFNKELKAANKDWDLFGEKAPAALRSLLLSFPAVIDRTKELQKAVRDMVDELRDYKDELDDLIQTQREAAGVDDLEQSQASLREEIERLENSTTLSAEQISRLDDAKGELIQTENDLKRAVRDTGLEILEANRAQIEGELSAAELAEREAELAERYGDAGDAAGILSKALGEFAGQQKDATKATEDGATAIQEETQETHALVSALKAATEELKKTKVEFLAHAKEVGAAWKAELNEAIDKLKEAKQCMVDLQGATDEV